MTPPQGVLQVRGERGVPLPLIGVDPHDLGGPEGFAQLNADFQHTVLLQLLREGTPESIDLFDSYKPDMHIREPLGKTLYEVRISDWAEEATREGFLDRSSVGYHQLALTFHRNPQYSSEPELDRKLEAEASRRRENQGIMYFPEEAIGNISPERRHLRYLQRQVEQERIEAAEQEEIRLQAEEAEDRRRMQEARKLALEEIILAKADAIRLRRAREELTRISGVAKADSDLAEAV